MLESNSVCSTTCGDSCFGTIEGQDPLEPKILCVFEDSAWSEEMGRPLGIGGSGARPPNCLFISTSKTSVCRTFLLGSTACTLALLLKVAFYMH